jgi:hypothetical protein
MDPWLSPIRTFPAEAHIVVTSGFCGKSVGRRREGEGGWNTFIMADFSGSRSVSGRGDDSKKLKCRH